MLDILKGFGTPRRLNTGNNVINRLRKYVVFLYKLLLPWFKDSVLDIHICNPGLIDCGDLYRSVTPIARTSHYLDEITV